ncbi:MAG: beta-L-arabinofuranosidase domain-containing protein [Candidatus Latescibacterota bacterium]
MSTIHFDKISKHVREKEPISVGIPFAQGQLKDVADFGVLNGDENVPVQVDVTGRWDDGSVKWLMAHFEVDLPGNRAHDVSFVCDGSVVNPTPDLAVSVTEKSEGVEIDTGVLKVVCAREGFDLFRQVVMNGKEVFGPGAFSGFGIVDDAGHRFETATIDQVEVIETGPVRGLVELSGKHTGEEGVLFDFRIVIEAWAGKPFLRVDYQFINREDAKSVDVSAIDLTFQASGSGVRMALGEGHYRTGVKEGEGEQVLNAEAIIYQAVEHVMEVFYGDFWADWCDGEKGVCVTPFQAHQNFPKGLRVHEGGIDVGILPAGEGPIKMLQGVAKTHRMQFYFHDKSMSLDDVVIASLQFQYPDVGMLSEAWYRDSGVWENLFPEQKCQVVEQGIINMADGRNQGLGMMHWGDGPDHGYTQQGRGKGELVWTNNEYDFPHAMFLLFAKTGERRFRDVGLVAAQHWIDVDFCHHSDDPMKMGGQPIHTAGHVTGGVTPSHEWTEGLLDYYHLTGKREAYEKAIAIADNVLRQLASPKFSKLGGSQARETGWAMRGLIAVYNETKEQKYLDACKLIAEQFLAWRSEFGSFLAPYTSHTQVRVPFMISIAVNALYRYYKATNDHRIPDLIVEEMRDVLQNCVLADDRFFYKELPSLHRRSDFTLQMEALSYAYQLSGDTQFRDHILTMMRSMMKRGFGGGGGGKRIVKDMVGDTVLFDGPGPKVFAFFYIPFMVAYKTLADENLLTEFEYRSI